MRKHCWLILALLSIMPVQVLAAESKTIPTAITSERMRYDAVKQKVIFEGNVYVKRPDFELWATTITVVLDKQKKNASRSGKEGAGASGPGAGMEAGQIERIIAENNVRIQQEGKVGTAGKMTYTLSDRKVVMENNPVLVDGSNRIKGKTINFFTADGRSEVIGGVEAHFTTSDKQDAGPLGIPAVVPSPGTPAAGSGKQ